MEPSDAYKYYDWNKTLSYDAELSFVITARGRGKTYGIRLQAVREALRDGTRFVEICRHTNELPGVVAGYFDKFITNNEFPGVDFMTRGDGAYARKEGEDWQLIGYFVSLTNQQALKKHTFDNVRRIIYDEVILDATDKFHHYLPNEYNVFVNLLDTITRQRPGEPTRARVYLLGNSVDMVNPYFRAFGINRMPEYGYHWYKHKHVLLHYEPATEWGTARKETTLVGHLISEEEAGRTLFNDFGGSDEFVEQKPSRAIYTFGVYYNGEPFGVWVDGRTGMIYVTDKIPKNDYRTYALTLDDQRIDYNVLDRTNKTMRTIADAQRFSGVRYSSVMVQEKFKGVLALYGLR